MPADKYAVPRSRVPLVLTIVAAVILVVGVAVWAFSRPATEEKEPGDQVENGSESVELAHGCLGGADPATAVLTAQTEAPHTGDGAAAFLASYVRWWITAPRLPEAEREATQERIYVDDLAEKYRKLPTFPASEEAQATFVGRHYRVVSQEGDTVTVELTMRITSATSRVLNIGAVMKARVDGDRWRFAGFDQERMDEAAGTDSGRAFRTEIDSQGLPFQEAC